MKVAPHQTIEEFIRDDVHDIVVRTVRVPRLAYLANWSDVTHLLQRLKPDIGDAEFHARDFELRTAGGLVRVMGDRSAPRGVVHRMVICSCGALTLYMPGVEQCLNCITLKPRAQMLHHVRIVGMPDNGCPQLIGNVGAISRLGVGRYRLRVDGPVGTVDLAHRSKRLTWVSLGAFTENSIDIDLWSSTNDPVDLESLEEILVSYIIRHPYAPGEKMTDRHPDSLIAQVPEETIEEAWRRFDREHPRTEINIGDRVRWWPHVTALGIPSADASYSDGIIVDRDVIRIESHGPNRWSSKDGLVGDLRSCAGGLIRRLPLRVSEGGTLSFHTAHGPIKVTADPTVPPGEARIVTTCPDYNAVFHIEPDPPDLAQRQAARLAKHQRREAEQPERGPFDYDVPRSDGILNDLYAPPAAARADGFDQRQVDAAKVALLAPVPPRYARTR